MLNEEFLIPSSEGLKSQTTPWPPRLAFDFAMGDDPDAIMQRYDLSPTAFQYLLITPTFMKEVDAHRQYIIENGITFKYKARLQAEEYLMTLDEIIHSADSSPAVKLDAIKSVVKWSGYEADTKGAAQQGGSNQTRLVIQWGDGSGQIALENINTCQNNE